MYLQTLDIAVVAIYAVLLLVLAHWVSREKPGHEKTQRTTFWPAAPCHGGRSEPH